MGYRIRTFLLLSILLTSVHSTFSQEDKIGKKKSVKINAKITPVKKASDLKIDANKGFKNAFKNSQKNKTQAQKDAALKNKGIISQAKVNEERWAKNFKAINGQYKRVDQHLGDFRSNSKYVRIICRDYQYPDGDRVTIYINDIPAIYNIVLTQTYQEFKIPLQKGINKIAFKALNQGTSGPNTAAFKVYDDAESLISANEWNLATGAIATLLIVKDK
mgnify:CR=1 FL=1